MLLAKEDIKSMKYSWYSSQNIEHTYNGNPTKEMEGKQN